VIISGAGVFNWQANRTSPPDYVPAELSSYEEEIPEDSTPLEEVFTEDVTPAEESSQIYEPVSTEHPILQMPRIISATVEEQAANLQKLAMVWGFTKYTHLAFLTGERCWDAELLELIPIVQFAEPDDVNDLLYSWFVRLGDDGWHGNQSVFLLAQLDENLQYQLGLADMSELWDVVPDIVNSVHWLSNIGLIAGADYSSIGLRVDANYFNAISENDAVFGWLYSLETISNEYIKHLVDMSWLTDESFLGGSLATVFSRFTEAPMVDMTNAPLTFSTTDIFSRHDFSNQNTHPTMNYSDAGYRLLGLFRIWNAMKYFFPHIDIIEYCWNELLLTYIPIMLEGEDELSYAATLASLTSHLRDPHIWFTNTLWMLDEMFGEFIAPVILKEAEGHLVMSEQLFVVFEQNRVLLPGDVVLAANGVDISEIAANMLHYLPYPNEERVLEFLAQYHLILRQHTNDEPMELDILRDGTELTVNVDVLRITSQMRMEGGRPFYVNEAPSQTYEILENNIGLINTSMIWFGGASAVMHSLANTDGLIIDLRRPPGIVHWELAEFIVEETLLYFRLTRPLGAIPGSFIDILRGYSGGFRGAATDPFLYENPVVLLMDIGTFSNTETAVMSLRSGANVTVIGSNSIGGNGDIARVFLPGGIDMAFTSLGVFAPDGGRTHFIGLEPDIRVDRTIAGIREGRDELMEAAIEFISGNFSP